MDLLKLGGEVGEVSKRGVARVSSYVRRMRQQHGNRPAQRRPALALTARPVARPISTSGAKQSKLKLFSAGAG